MFIGADTSRANLEIAATEAGLPVLADTEELRASIVRWIEEGDECASA